MCATKKDNKKVSIINISAPIKSTIMLDNVIINDIKKQEIVNNVNNYITFYKDKKNVEIFKELYSYGNGLIMLFTGTSGCGKTMLAHAIANHFNMKIANVSFNNKVDVDYIDCCFDTDVYDISKTFTDDLNKITMDNCIVIMDEIDKTEYRSHNMRQLFSFIESFTGILICISNDHSWANGNVLRRIHHIYNFNIPTIEEQNLIWRTNIPKEYKAAFSDIDFNVISKKYNFTGGIIKNIIQSATREYYSNNSAKITIEDLEKLCISVSRQTFSQYFNNNSVTNKECFFNGYQKDENSIISIDKKYYKDQYNILNKMLSSYSKHREIYSKSSFSNNSIYDTTIRKTGRTVIVNCNDIGYTLHLMLKILSDSKQCARIIKTDSLFYHKYMIHPLYKTECLFIEAIADDILGIRCPTILIDNEVNDLINKLVMDLKIISSKNSKRKMRRINGTNRGEEDISESDENNTTNSISSIGDLLMTWMHHDYNDTYMLINCNKSQCKQIESCCNMIDGFIFMDLEIKNSEKDSGDIFKRILYDICGNDVSYNNKKINMKSLVNMNAVTISMYIKQAYMKAYNDHSGNKKSFNDRFYEAINGIIINNNGNIDTMPSFS